MYNTIVKTRCRFEESNYLNCILTIYATVKFAKFISKGSRDTKQKLLCKTTFSSISIIFLFPAKQHEILYFHFPQHFEPACRVFTIYSYPSSVLHTTACFTTSGAIYLCELHSFRYSVYFCFRLHIKTGNSFRISFSIQQFFLHAFLQSF